MTAERPEVPEAPGATPTPDDTPLSPATTSVPKRRESLWRQGLRFLLRAAIAAAIVAVLAFVGINGAAWAYDQFGYHPARNAASWAALTPSYADTSLCQKCHADQYARWQKSKHAGVACESCHGALGAHAADPTTAAAGTNPTAEECLTCHQQATGRPASFPQVVLATHYSGASCLQCHNAHTTIAEAPAQITHSLANGTACVTCHGPDALKPFPVGHQVAADAVCLGCHKPAQAGQ